MKRDELHARVHAKKMIVLYCALATTGRATSVNLSAIHAVGRSTAIPLINPVMTSMRPVHAIAVEKMYG
jgi:hypothetical protein